MQHTRAERGQLKHLVIGDLIHFMRIFHQARIRCINAVHICINLTQISMQSGGQRDRACIRASASECCDIIITIDSLETCHNNNIAFGKLIIEPFLIDAADTRRAMGRIRQHATRSAI